jgi:hypothetical protein
MPRHRVRDQRLHRHWRVTCAYQYSRLPCGRQPGSLLGGVRATVVTHDKRKRSVCVEGEGPPEPRTSERYGPSPVPRTRQRAEAFPALPHAAHQ